MKERIVGRGGDRADESVAIAERIVVVAAALDEFADIPFEIGRGSGAGFDADKPAGAEAGHHEDAGVDYGLGRKHLIDATRSRQ